MNKEEFVYQLIKDDFKKMFTEFYKNKRKKYNNIDFSKKYIELSETCKIYHADYKIVYKKIYDLKDNIKINMYSARHIEKVSDYNLTHNKFKSNLCQRNLKREEYYLKKLERETTKMNENKN